MIQISTALNDQRLAGVITFLGLGTPAAVARLYSGTRPAFGTAPTGTLLVEIPLQEPIGQVANGSLAITPSDEALILADGVATWARVLNGEGAIAWDCDVSNLAGTGEIRISSTTLYAGGYTRIISGTLG